MANVVFILSGSIACYKACDAISKLVQRGHAVRAVATEAARRFVGVPTLEGLTRAPVGTDLWAAGEALDHITWARWADVTILCPATAHTLNRMAAGLGDDLAGALLLAHEWTKPLLVAPAMNPAMWSHPATQASVRQLERWGVRFVRPGEGRTACGEVGEGRLAEPMEIVAAIEAAAGGDLPSVGLAKEGDTARHQAAAVESGAGLPLATRRRVLITSGGTSEPVDGVRVLTNLSTGATGAGIAEAFVRAGHEVVLLRATQAVAGPAAATEETFTTFADLEALLTRQLAGTDFDAVIHAAAVSDFAVEAVEIDGKPWAAGSGKMPSGAAPVIRLRRNPKLLDRLRAGSRNPAMRVVAFKLTRDASADAARAAVDAILKTGAADFVVHNDLGWRTAAGTFPADIWARDGTRAAHCDDRAALATALVRLVT